MGRTRIAAIEVGTTKVCTIMTDIAGIDLPHILSVGVVPSHGLRRFVSQISRFFC